MGFSAPLHLMIIVAHRWWVHSLATPYGFPSVITIIETIWHMFHTAVTGLVTFAFWPIEVISWQLQTHYLPICFAGFLLLTLMYADVSAKWCQLWWKVLWTLEQVIRVFPNALNNTDPQNQMKSEVSFTLYFSDHFNVQMDIDFH